MVCFPNAKINLGLDILAKRTDGFHTIESCFYPVNWSDGLEIIPSSNLRFSSSGLPIPGDALDNLCMRIYHALQNDFDLAPIHIHLLKKIPIGAGLGGGSADAAFAAKALNELFNLQLTEEKLEDYVRPLGSDCAFFIKNKPVFCYEKGDRFEPIQVSLKNYSIALVYPNLHISTKEAYGGVIPKQPEFALKNILTAGFDEWRLHLKNDFEQSLFPRYPVLNELKEYFYGKNALYASMTGSGSTIYGIFPPETNPDVIKTTIAADMPKEYEVWVGRLE